MPCVQAKEAALPEEPPASVSDPLVTVVLRFPDGSRLTRRFRTSDLLQTLFDFTDAKVTACNTHRLRQHGSATLMCTLLAAPGHVGTCTTWIC